MATGAWQLDRLERAFADAAFNPAGWADAVHVAECVTESAGAILLPVTGARIPDTPMSDRLREVTETYFRHRWHERDERFKGMSLMMKRGVIDDLDFFDVNYINRHPYYQEFLAPFGLRWFAGVRIAFGGDVWCLSIQRTIAQGPFSLSEKQKLQQLSDRLTAGAVLAKAVGLTSAAATLETLDRSGSAALLINGLGEVFQMNGAAERVLNGEIRIVNRRLTARDRKATDRFDRALHQLIWDRSDAALSSPVALRDGPYPLLAYLIKPSAFASNIFADCKAIAILVEVGARTRIPETTLRIAFQLTTAEARLASRLGAGHAIEDIANEVGLAQSTLRSQLKAVFAKTDTHRQSDLVALLRSVTIGPK